MKKIIRKIAQKFGFDITRYRQQLTPGARLVKIFKDRDIDLVIDVGANKGQFAGSLFEHGYTGTVISFEPLQEEHEYLIKESAKYSNWETAERCALGDTEGRMEINVSENKVSSSLLDILPAATQADPSAGYTGREEVDVRRLDKVLKERIHTYSNPFLKIDVQGFEEKVLKGASGIMDRITGIHIELSLVPLYKDEPVLTDMLESIGLLGFSLYDMETGFRDHQSGRLLQADVLFLKET